jgi:hypothetical protein
VSRRNCPDGKVPINSANLSCQDKTFPKIMLRTLRILVDKYVVKKYISHSYELCLDLGCQDVVVMAAGVVTVPKT